MEVDIDYNGFPLTVIGDFTPAEDSIMYYRDMSGTLGSPSQFDVHEVYLSDSSHNIFELLDDDQVREVESLILEKL